MNRHFTAVSMFAIAMSVSWGMSIWIGSTIAVLLILQLSVVVIVLQCGAKLAYIAAVAEAVCFNFLFTMPRYSLEMFHFDDIVNLLVFLIVAFTTSQLAERYRKQQNTLEQVKLRHQILLSVSHDLRTPLAGIIGNVTTLKEYQAQLNDTEKNELLDCAITESHRLHQYIENLLQATKLQHGVIRIKQTPESVLSILDTVVARFSNTAERIQVVAEQGLQQVAVSRALFEQALFNILDNALRYSPQASPVTVTLRQSQGQTQVDIFNQSESLNKDEVKNMFELFYSGAANRSNDSGSGLGLSVAKGVISAHQGTIECIDLSHGCLIRITLPTNQTKG
ncbi:sensor histidine kinase [Pseudoalteromonas rubra]|uniref:sensor histidine kinase n=1 Tax=Pseudoalteromonas rubra TaxID=43658 RepID=UPI001F0C18BA|nr:ATP-binding protein [Pseudoalteromonas rubra]